MTEKSTEVLAVWISIGSLVVGILAFILSLANFYFINVRISHHLYAVVSYPFYIPPERDRTIKDYSSHLEFNIILVNGGNRTDAVLRVAISYRLGRLGNLTSPGPAKFVLKPGDIEMIRLADDMNLLMQNLENVKPDWADLGILVRAIMKDGTVSSKEFPLGRIRNFKHDGEGSRGVELMLEKYTWKFDII